MIQNGDIQVYDHIGQLYAKIIHKLTRKPYTHASIGYGCKIEENVIEALATGKGKVTTTPFAWYRTPSFRIWVFRFKAVPKEIIDTAANILYNSCLGQDYGQMQLLYFLPRFIWETYWIRKYFGWIPRLFGKDPDKVIKWNNPFKKGIICTELVFMYMKIVCDLCRQHGYTHLLGLEQKLNLFNKDNVHAGDIMNLLKGFPDVFMFTESHNV